MFCKALITNWNRVTEGSPSVCVFALMYTWAGLCGCLGVHCVWLLWMTTPQAVLSHSGFAHTKTHTQNLTSLLAHRGNQSIFSSLWQCIHCMGAQSQRSDSAECLRLSLSSQGPSVKQPGGWVLVRWASGFLWCGVAAVCVLYQLSKPNTGRRSSSVCSLLNIDWGSQTMGERNLCYPPAPTSPSLYCSCKKKTPGHRSGLGLCPSSALIHVLPLPLWSQGLLAIVRHRRWYVLWGHSDFVSPLPVNQTLESLPTDMTS